MQGGGAKAKESSKNTGSCTSTDRIRYRVCVSYMAPLAAAPLGAMSPARRVSKLNNAHLTAFEGAGRRLSQHTRQPRTARGVA
jgi:hypothetical protein